MLNRVLCAATLATVLFCGAQARAQGNAHPFGLGLAVGDPSAITARFWLNNDEALQFNFGWFSNYYRGDYLRREGGIATVDWVHHFGRFGPKNRKVWFRVHVGAGGGLGAYSGGCYRDLFGYYYCPDGDLGLIARVPIGFNVYLAKVRFEFYGEIAPGFRVFPETRPLMFSQAGARYYF